MKVITASGGALVLVCSMGSQAAFYDDSHLTLGMRNFYVDRDFKQENAPKSRVGSWSQGFDLQFKSGYTDGPVQFGLDLSSQFAFRLDGGGGRGPDTVLPYDDSKGKPVHEYGRSGATLKAKISKTEIKFGEHRPTLPVAYMDDSRQLVTVYEGATIESKEWDKLTLNAGRFWNIASRESTDREKLYLAGGSPNARSDGLNFAGARYDITPKLNATYYFGQLEDFYNQHYLGLTYVADLGNGYSLKNDVRYYNNTGQGSEIAGDYDNRSLGLMTALRKGGNTFTVAWQRMYGDDAFPLFNGYAPQPTLVNWSTIAFYKAGERSWQARYDYDFAALGVPGLKFMTRYLKGTDIQRGSGLADNQESESNFVVSYVVQSGPLNGLGMEVRNINVKTKYGADFVENRVVAMYTWKFW